VDGAQSLPVLLLNFCLVKTLTLFKRVPLLQVVDHRNVVNVVFAHELVACHLRVDCAGRSAFLNEQKKRVVHDQYTLQKLDVVAQNVEHLVTHLGRQLHEGTSILLKVEQVLVLQSRLHINHFLDESVVQAAFQIEDVCQLLGVPQLCATLHQKHVECACLIDIAGLYRENTVNFSH